MDLREYRQSILEDVKVSASAEMNFEALEFLNKTTNILMEVEELPDFFPCYFEGVGKRNRKIQIDGFVFDDLDDSLCIISNCYSGAEELKVLTQTEIEKIFSRSMAFVEESNLEFIQNEAEESSPGFGLAFEIKHKLDTNAIKKFRFYLVTDFLISDRIKQLNYSTLLGLPVEFNVWDVSRFYKVHESLSGKEDITIDFKEFTPSGIPCLKASHSNEEKYDAYLCVIPGDILADLYNRYGGRLLEGNVRSFLSVKGKVNKGIRSTILNNPEMFFAYNNGIAATAIDIQLELGTKGTYISAATSLQIVNGGQTTASLALAKLNDKADLKSIHVPMKLSVLAPSRAEQIIPDISKYANSQNKVSDSDFFSNHPFHIAMEGFSRRLLAPATGGYQHGTRWYYERARGQYAQEMVKLTPGEKKKFMIQNPKTQLFTKTDLAKYINIYRMLPNIVSAGAQKNFLNFAGWIGKKWIEDNLFFNEVFYRKTIALAIIHNQTQKLISKLPWFENSYRANVMAYTLSKLFDVIENDYPEYAFDFKLVWQKQTITGATIKQIEVLAKIVFDSITSPDRGIQNVTEWCKREECWNRIKEITVKLNPEFENELIPKSEELYVESGAKKEQRLINKVNTQIEVISLGSKYWTMMYEWAVQHKLLSQTEIEILSAACRIDKGIIPTEKQCQKIVGIREKVKLEGYSA